MEILELKSIIEMKNLLEGLNSRFNLEEERNRKLEGRSIHIMQIEKRLRT